MHEQLDEQAEAFALANAHSGDAVDAARRAGYAHLAEDAQRLLMTQAVSLHIRALALFDLNARLGAMVLRLAQLASDESMPPRVRIQAISTMFRLSRNALDPGRRRPPSGGERKAKQTVGRGDERDGALSHHTGNGRVGGVEAASERAEGRQDDLGRGLDEAAPRDAAAAHGDGKLGVKMARNLRSGVSRVGLVAQDDAVHLGLDHHAATDGRAKPRIMVARDPGPVEPMRQLGKAVPGRRGQALHAGRIMEAVAQAPKFAGVGGVGHCLQAG